MTNVLVYGGTGLQASAIARALVRDGHRVSSLTHSPDKAESIRAMGAHPVIGDLFNPESVRAANAGIDVAAVTLPFFLANPLTLAQNVIDAARANGVRLIVYNTSGPLLKQRIGNPAYDTRHDIIDALAASGIPYIAIQPSVYLENLLGPWTRGGILERDVLEYPVDVNTPLGWISHDDLGALVAAAVARAQLASAVIPVSGVENVTGPELAARISEGLGRTIRYQAITPEAFGELLERYIGPGAGEGAAAGYRFQRDHADMIPMWTDMTPVLQLLPVTMTAISEWARRMAFLQTPEPQTT